MSMIAELEATAKRVAAILGPATVAIGQEGRGTGVVIAPNQVLTNAHNLRDRSTTVTFSDGRSAQGSVVGTDVDGDLVIVAVDTGPAAALAWAPAEQELEPGSAVFAASRGGKAFRLSFGLVSGVERSFRGPRGRRIAGSVEHSALLPRGSSGGPLVDAEGRLVGINTNRSGAGLYLARPADAALRARVANLQAGHSAVRRSLGVSVLPADAARRLRRAVGLPERDGLLVRGVQEGSPAHTAGLLQGDLLVRTGERDLRTADDLHEVLDALGGDPATITFSVLRGVEELTVSVQFGAPEAPAAGG